MNVTVLPWRFATFLQMYLVPHELIGHLQQRLELHVDLALAGGGHLMVVRLDDDADLAHLVDHLAAEVVIRVCRADREVAAFEAWLVAEIRFLDAGRVPCAFRRIDLVVAAVLVLLVADLVEDEELGFRSDEAGVGDARFLQIRFRLPGDVPRITAEVLPGHRVDDVGDDADGRLGKERIEPGGVGIGDGQHVGFMDAHPATDRRTVETEALLERARVERVDGVGAVLPRTQHVHELQVDHLGLVLFGELKEIVGCHRRLLEAIRCSEGVA